MDRSGNVERQHDTRRPISQVLFPCIVAQEHASGSGLYEGTFIDAPIYCAYYVLLSQLAGELSTKDLVPWICTLVGLGSACDEERSVVKAMVAGITSSYFLVHDSPCIEVIAYACCTSHTNLSLSRVSLEPGKALN